MKVVRSETALLETGEKTYYSNWEVRPAGNLAEVYPPTGYSKFKTRLESFNKGDIKRPEQIYGLAQALDHIQELRRVVKKGTNPLGKADFEVVEVTIIKTSYKTVNL